MEEEKKKIPQESNPEETKKRDEETYYSEIEAENKGVDKPVYTQEYFSELDPTGEARREKIVEGELDEDSDEET